MSTKSENELVTTEQVTGELAPSHAQAMARHEIEGSIVVAQRFPRNELEAMQRVMKSCQRWSFANMARYSYPRGKEQIEGPSVQLAREAARCWGNLRYGCDIIHDDEKTRTVRGWAWDLETNTYKSQDATFDKLIYRKGKGLSKPNERDLRELTNSHGARCERNCLLHIMPPDMVDDAIAASKVTLKNDVTADPDEAMKKMIRAFSGVGVVVEDLESYLKHPLRQATPDEIVILRGVYKSILDGHSRWDEYVADSSGKTTSIDEFTKGKPPAEPDTPASDTKTVDPTDRAKQLDEFAEEYRQAGENKDLAAIEELDAKAKDDPLLQDGQAKALLQAYSLKARNPAGE